METTMEKLEDQLDEFTNKQTNITDKMHSVQLFDAKNKIQNAKDFKSVGDSIS